VKKSPPACCSVLQSGSAGLRNVTTIRSTTLLSAHLGEYASVMMALHAPHSTRIAATGYPLSCRCIFMASKCVSVVYMPWKQSFWCLPRSGPKYTSRLRFWPPLLRPSSKPIARRLLDHVVTERVECKEELQGNSESYFYFWFATCTSPPA
jgi:hypothetical protein